MPRRPSRALRCGSVARRGRVEESEFTGSQEFGYGAPRLLPCVGRGRKFAGRAALRATLRHSERGRCKPRRLWTRELCVSAVEPMAPASPAWTHLSPAWTAVHFWTGFSPAWTAVHFWTGFSPAWTAVHFWTGFSPAWTACCGHFGTNRRRSFSAEQRERVGARAGDTEFGIDIRSGLSHRGSL